MNWGWNCRAIMVTPSSEIPKARGWPPPMREAISGIRPDRSAEGDTSPVVLALWG